MGITIEERLKYLFDHSYCGKPLDLRESVMTERGEVIVYCEECFDLQDDTRKCLSCGEEFHPGCNIKHTCKYCVKRNRLRTDRGLE